MIKQIINNSKTLCISLLFCIYTCVSILLLFPFNNSPAHLFAKETDSLSVVEDIDSLHIEPLIDSLSVVESIDSLHIEQETDSLFVVESIDSLHIEPLIDSLYVEILSPESLHTIKSGFNTLWGFVYGVRLSLLEKEDFSWYSDIDGFLEHGKIANIYSLSPGIHRITFTVQNNNGNTASDTVITVVQDKYITKEPVEIDNSEPKFPDDYDAEGIMGISMHINEEGSVDSVIILENTIKDSIIEETVMDWTENVNFYPAEENGKTKSTWIIRSYKLPIDKEELAAAEKEKGTTARRPRVSDGEKLRREREEKERLRKLLGTGKPVAMSGLPNPIIRGFTEVSKKKKSIIGMIKTCIKVDFAGFVIEIVIIENTFEDDWVEKDLIRMLYNSLYEPITESGGARYRECFTAFTIENNYFKEMKEGDFITWKDEYRIEYVSLIKGSQEIDFSEKIDDTKSAVGVFRMIAEINPEGEAKNIQEIEKTINRGSLKNLFVDTYKDFEYYPASINNFPVKSYMLPYFSFNNPQYFHFKKILLSYNSGFQFYIKGKYNIAIKDFKDALRADSRNDFIDLIPQIIFCYEYKEEKDEKKKLELYEEALRKNSYYRNFDIFKKLNEDYNTLQESFSKKVSFFSLLSKDRYDLKKIYSFISESDKAQSRGGPFVVYSELKYPDNAMEARFEGTAEIALLIIPSGQEEAKVKYAKVLKSTGDKKTNRAAIKALKKLKYSPTSLENDKVNSWISQSIIFSLSDDFKRRLGNPERNEIDSKRPAPFKKNEVKYLLQEGLPPMLVKGKSKFSKADDKTKGYIRACVEIDSTGTLRDILILSNNVSKDSLDAEREFALMLAESVFDPINLTNGPEKQKFLCAFKVQDKFFVQQRNIVFKEWHEENAFKFPIAVENNQSEFFSDNFNSYDDTTSQQTVDMKSDSDSVKVETENKSEYPVAKETNQSQLSSDTSGLSIDTTSQQTAVIKSDIDSIKKQDEIPLIDNKRFNFDWSEIDAIVEEETDSTTEGIFEFIFRIDEEGNVTLKKEKSVFVKSLSIFKPLRYLNPIPMFGLLPFIGKKNEKEETDADADTVAEDVRNEKDNAKKVKEDIKDTGEEKVVQGDKKDKDVEKVVKEKGVIMKSLSILNPMPIFRLLPFIGKKNDKEEIAADADTVAEDVRNEKDTTKKVKEDIKDAGKEKAAKEYVKDKDTEKVKEIKKVKKILVLKNTLKNAGNLKENIFDTILNYKFIPGKSDTTSSGCYVHKRYVFHKKDENKFGELLKEYNSAYREVLKGKDGNAVKKLEKVAKLDNFGDFLGIYPLMAVHYLQTDKVLKALNLYYEGIKKFAYYNDFDNMNYLANELMLFKQAVWEKEDLYFLIQKEKAIKKARMLADQEEKKPVLTEPQLKSENQDTAKIFAVQSEETPDSLAQSDKESKKNKIDKKESLANIQAQGISKEELFKLMSDGEDSELLKTLKSEPVDSLTHTPEEPKLIVEDYDEKGLLSVLPEENRPKLIGSIDSVFQHIKYPKLKDGETVKGTVVVAVLVDKDGDVKEAEIKESIRNKKFDEAALKAAKELKFEPAVFDYEPIEHWFTLSIDFDSSKINDLSYKDK